MSWGLGWKRPSEIFHLTLHYGNENLPEASSSSDHQTPPPHPPSNPNSRVQDQNENHQLLGFRIDLEWTAGDDEEQVSLRLQSQLMVALPSPQDTVSVEIKEVTRDEEDTDRIDDCELNDDDEDKNVSVEMRVFKRRDPLRGVIVTKSNASGQQSDGVGVLIRLLTFDFSKLSSVSGGGSVGGGEGPTYVACADHWKTVTVLSLSGIGLSVLPAELTKLPLLEKLYLENNKLSVLPPELGYLKNLKVLRVDYNMLVSIPVELKQCVELVELSVEYNKLVRPLLDFRAMAELRVLKLFANPLEFLPEILPLSKLRHFSLANIRIEADEYLRSVSVQIETENSSYFIQSRHKLSAFFSLIFRFSSCHHPLLASALAKIMQDQANRVVVGKDENAVRQLISMISSDDAHVVEQACNALSSLAADFSVAMQLIKLDIMRPIVTVLRSVSPETVMSVLQVVGNLAFTSDAVAQKMLTKDLLKSLKSQCTHKNPEVQRLALLAIGNLAFSLENRRTLATSESLRDFLLRLTAAPVPHVRKAAARALAILGENENLRRAIKGRPVAKQGLRILVMDGGGMKGLATVQILKEISKGTGKAIHEMFDLICGTSTGGMLAVALGVKRMTLDQCEEIYKNLGKLVFAEPVPKDNEAASWREKLDQLYKSSSQSFRVVVHGSKHSADQFEQLLREMCTDEDGDLMIESAVKDIPKVFIVSTLVSMVPAQPFIFRNYQYPAGTREIPHSLTEGSGLTGVINPIGSQVGYKRCAFLGSCKHHVWQAIRASSAAPYYLDDYSDDVHRWQDGAIVANNPGIFAIREAQLLWPDTRIDCLVSIGCGSVPTKVRKGGWRYLDTGQVLIESACSVDRVEEALSTLLPMLPEMHYFRFNPVDERCDMELDETDPAVWQKLENATNEYMLNNSEAFKNACERLLLHGQHDEKWLEDSKHRHSPSAKVTNADEHCPSLGWRRSVLLVEAMHSPDSGRMVHHARSLESFCAQSGIKLSSGSGVSLVSRAVPATSFPTPFSSPLFTGSFPSSPLLYSPDIGQQRIGRIDLVPPFSLDGLQPANTSSPPASPLGPRQLSLPARLLNDRLQNSPQVGIVHLALQNDSTGSILSWQNDVFVVAEPGELADKFLQSVKLSLLSVMRSHRRVGASVLANISTMADLVACRQCFQIGGIVHRYIGRQTQVMEDDQEIGAYMFRRTVPSIHLTPDDVRHMVGAWRDRIIICTGTYGPTPSMIKAFLDSGSKAVICPSAEPSDAQSSNLQGSGDLNVWENGKFEIGEEDAEDDEEAQPISPRSDWEDSDAEKNSDNTKNIWDDDEEELSRFVCKLYESIFQEGATVEGALRRAFSSNRKLRYKCHLPRIP